MIKNFLGKPSYSTANTKEVTSSPIISKAVIRRENGDHQIIVVFQKSTRLEFYWVFRAKSPRSSRRSWKLASFYPRDFPFETKPYRDFGSFVSYYAALHRSTVLSQRNSHKKRMSAMLNKVEHQSIYANWAPQDPSTIKTDMIRRRMTNARSRRFAW